MQAVSLHCFHCLGHICILWINGNYTVRDKSLPLFVCSVLSVLNVFSVSTMTNKCLGHRQGSSVREENKLWNNYEYQQGFSKHRKQDEFSTYSLQHGLYWKQAQTLGVDLQPIQLEISRCMVCTCIWILEIFSKSHIKSHKRNWHQMCFPEGVGLYMCINIHRSAWENMALW